MKLVYFPIAGRGELSRLIAAVGGIEDFESDAVFPDGVTAKCCGSTGSMPCLVDGDLKMNESGAIETYLGLVAPNFANLTPKQRAKDVQMSAMKETCLGAFAGIGFPLSPEDRASGAKRDDMKALIDKYYSVIESNLPDEGFVNGLDGPTVADLAIVNMTTAYMIFGWAMKHGGVDLEKDYPKIHGLSERTKAVESVATFLANSPTLSAPFPGF